MPAGRRRPRRRLLVASVAALIGTALFPAFTEPAAAAIGAPRAGFPVSVAGAKFQWASPAIADVNGDASKDVVAGGQDRRVYAVDQNGAAVPGFPALAPGPISATPAVADLDQNRTNEVIVGFGDLSQPTVRGGVTIFNTNGTLRCTFLTSTQFGVAQTAVFGTPAIGDVDGDGRSDVVFGSFDHRIYAIRHDCVLIDSFDNLDTVWSSPGLYDEDLNGTMEIYIGGDATAGAQPHSGGFFRALRWNGTDIVQKWVRPSDETFQSGVAIGDIDGDGLFEAITGSGSDYCRNFNRCTTDSRRVWAFHLEDGTDVAGWPKLTTREAHFIAAPALGDIDGDGRTDVVLGSTSYTATGNLDGGTVDAFLGNGNHWAFNGFGDPEVTSPPVIADVTGGGPSEVIVNLDGRVFVLDGAGGVVQSNIGLGPSNQPLVRPNASAVGEIGPGRWGLATNSFDPGDGNRGYVHVYDIPTPTAIPFGQHKQNAGHTGSAASVPKVCTGGYWLLGGDGGVFSFGDRSFKGSTGDRVLNQPIVALADTPSHQGYWFVAKDGGIFNFGDAGFFGSTGGSPPSSPVVGMAATPDGQGYWLVTARGQVFNFGTAGHMGDLVVDGLTPNLPVVGIERTASGDGYWLVATDGGIFSYGQAPFLGSTGNIVLNQPVVAMTAHPNGRGYWFTASDGGVFTYGPIGFFGSTGNRPLPAPVVFMSASPSGNGYAFAGADGGVYSFGDMGACGGVNNLTLNFPIVGMS